ncbi:MAG: glycosyltransferase [Deltaproteobacteria bacterium]|nr:glycosyltransferase [Deltaproteobacteria bacterium]
MDFPSPPKGKKGWPWENLSEPLPETMPDGKPWPRISIVTPSYNQGRFIEKTIRSVLLQGYPNLEYIIIDGGSNDESVDIIKKYEPWLSYWVSEPDRGQAHAINKGLNRATGEIFHWLNSDDQLLPGALAEVARAIRREPDAIGWVGGSVCMDTADKVLDILLPKNLDAEGLSDWLNNSIYQPGFFALTRAVLDSGGVEESLHYVFDVDLWLRLCKRGRFSLINKELARVLIHPDAKTQAQAHKSIAEHVTVLFKHGYEEQARSMVELIVFRERNLRRKVERVTSTFSYRILRPLLRFLGLVEKT